MDLIIVEWFQSFRTDFLDRFFSIITELGDETVFLLVAGFMFWIVSKKYGYRLMMIFLTSVAINNILKHIFLRQRPFQYSPDTVKSVVPPTHGYSLPSGHAQNSTTLSLVLNERFGKSKKWVTPLIMSMALLVFISRIYLGQHYLSDVILGVVVATCIYYVFIYFSKKIKINPQHIVYYATPFMLLLLVFVKDKNFYVSVAALIATTIGYQLEMKYINYDIKAPVIIQLIKYIIGLVVALALKEGLKVILPYPSGDEISQISLILDFIRYFILCLWLTLGSMYIFKKLFQKK